MPDLTKPIEVSPATGLIDLLTAAGRYAVVIATSVPILLNLLGTKDFLAIVAYFRGEDGNALIAAVVGLATLAYGLWKTRSRGAQAVILADAAPNSIARVK